MKTFYSQAGQDQAAFEVMGSSGYFIDFGCNDPSVHNNTYALEVEGWTGMLVDYDARMVGLCSKIRSDKNTYFHEDLSKCDISELLERANAPKDIAYISMDADEANRFIVERFPFDKYNVGFITFEHDLYRLGPSLKNLATEVFTKNGFELYKENVVANGYGEFEDWWINKNYLKE